MVMLQSLSFIHYPAWSVFRLSRQDPSADWVHFSMSQSGLEPDTWLCICGRLGSRGSPVCFKRPEAASDPPGRLAFTSPGMSRAFCGPALLTRLSSPCLASPGFTGFFAIPPPLVPDRQCDTGGCRFSFLVFGLI